MCDSQDHFELKNRLRPRGPSWSCKPWLGTSTQTHQRVWEALCSSLCARSSHPPGPRVGGSAQFPWPRVIVGQLCDALRRTGFPSIPLPFLRLWPDDPASLISFDKFSGSFSYAYFSSSVVSCLQQQTWPGQPGLEYYGKRNSQLVFKHTEGLLSPPLPLSIRI